VNISISEILMVALIALLVIKPEQLPQLAHTVGKWAKSFRRAFAKMKADMNELIEPVAKQDERQL